MASDNPVGERPSAVGPSRPLVAIPAWNEAATVGDVVQELRRLVPKAEILVVNDGSTDATADVARDAGAVTINLPFNVGVGGAMRTAFLYAQREGFDAVVQVDADGQHDPSLVRVLLDDLGDVDLVIGSRFAGGGNYDVGMLRRLTMRTLALALGRVGRQTFTDTTSGFRASGPKAIRLFAQHYPAEYLGDTVDSLVLALRAGLTVREVPAPMRPRQGGRPSHNPFKASLYLARSMLALGVALSRPPVVLEEP